TQEAERRFLITAVTVLSSFLIALLLLYVYYRLLTNELKVREEAEKAALSSVDREFALRQEQERFRLFVGAVKDYAIYVLDAEGRIASWNQGAERIHGYSAAEVVGKHFSLFFTEDDRRAGQPKQEIETAARVGQFEGEAWRMRKNGTQFWASVVLTAIKDE